MIRAPASRTTLKNPWWTGDNCVSGPAPQLHVVPVRHEHQHRIGRRLAHRVHRSCPQVERWGLEYVAWLTAVRWRTPDDELRRSRDWLTGQVKQIRHYRLGLQHDPAPGEPAVRGFFADGSRRYEEHFRYGRRHDVAGRAAIIKWRLDGTKRTELHYYEGLRIEVVVPTVAVLEDADAGTVGSGCSVVGWISVEQPQGVLEHVEDRVELFDRALR